MSQLEIDPLEIPGVLRESGVAGAGGAGFPSAVKWEQLDNVHSLLINHQESEPGYYSDKWLVREHASEFAAFLDGLLDAGAFERIVVGTKAKYREIGRAHV